MTKINVGANRGAGAQVCDRTHHWLWIQSLLEEIKYFFTLIFSFFSLWYRGKARR